MSITVRTETTADRPERQWVSLGEAADAAGVSISAIRRWVRNELIEARREGHAGATRTVVDVDEVLRRAGNRPGASRLEPVASGPPSPVTLLAALAVLARERAEEAEAQAEQLEGRIRELETWITGDARFDEVEHVQLGRLLALASAEREQRSRPLLASVRAALLFGYAAAALALAVLLATERI